MSDRHVVLHFSPVLEVLRYPSLASAKAMYIDQSVIFVCPGDFESRLSMGQIRLALRAVLREKYNEKRLPKSKPLLSEMAWQTLCRYATPHNPRAKRSGARAERRADARYRVAPLYFECMSKRMPPQVRAMVEYFEKEMSPNGVDEEGVEMLVRDMHDRGILITRQDPVRIWRYYRADMLSRCLLELI